MAKLSKKITNNQEENKEVKKISALSKKETTQNNEQIQENKSNEEVKKTTDINETSKQIISKIDFEKLSINEIRNLLNNSELTDAQLEKFIKNKLKIDEFESNLLAELANFQNQIENLRSEKEKLTQVNGRLETYVSNLKQQLETTEEQIFKIKKDYENVVPVEELVKFFLTEKINNFYTQKLVTLSKEAYLSGDKNAKTFVMAFLKNFVLIENAYLNLGEDETENMQILHQAGSKLLKNIAGKYASERRMMLDTLADFFTSLLETYKFISPEQTLQIDTQVHNAEGLGGNTIRYGLSFAVVRKETGKTVIFADVITQ